MKFTIVDTYANVAMKLVSLPVAHTTTIAGKAVTRWTHGYEMGTYARGPMLSLEKATEALTQAG